MSKKNRKKNEIQTSVWEAIVADEKRHKNLIPEKIKGQLKEAGKRTFQRMKKKKKPCDRKNKYATLAIADDVILQRQKEVPDLYLRSYECDYCRWCHITSQTEEENIVREQRFQALVEEKITTKLQKIRKS